MATTNDLKNGMVLNIDGQLWAVVEFQHVKPGKGPAFVRTKLKNVESGKTVDKTFNAGTKVETATSTSARCSTSTTTARRTSSWTPAPTSSSRSRPEIVGDAKNFLLENQDAIVATNDGRVLYIELPGLGRAARSPTPSRACRATAPPAAPSRPRWRPVTTIQVPLFINHGREGQGRHPRLLLPRSRQGLTADGTRTAACRHAARPASARSTCSTPRRCARESPVDALDRALADGEGPTTPTP